MAVNMLSELFHGANASSMADVPSATATPAVSSAISDIPHLLGDAWSANNAAPVPSVTMPGIESNSNTTNLTDPLEDDWMKSDLISFYCDSIRRMDPWTMALTVVGAFLVLCPILYCLKHCLRKSYRKRRRQTVEAKDEEIELEGRGISKAEQMRLKQAKKQTEKRIKELERKQASASTSQT